MDGRMVVWREKERNEGQKDGKGGMSCGRGWERKES